MADALRAARPKKVLFMVRKEYYDDIVAGEKREEIRGDTFRWQWLLGDDPPQVAVFICGRSPAHRRWITRIYKEKPSKVLGRPVSHQGMLDLGLPAREKEKECIVVELGDVYRAGDYCPKCGTELEEDPEDSSEGYCPKCNYGWRFPRKEVDEHAE